MSSITKYVFRKYLWSPNDIFKDIVVFWAGADTPKHKIGERRINTAACLPVSNRLVHKAMLSAFRDFKSLFYRRGKSDFFFPTQCDDSVFEKKKGLKGSFACRQHATHAEVYSGENRNREQRRRRRNECRSERDRARAVGVVPSVIHANNLWLHYSAFGINHQGIQE